MTELCRLTRTSGDQERIRGGCQKPTLRLWKNFSSGAAAIEEEFEK